MRILLIDDSEKDMRNFVDELRQAGCSVEQAAGLEQIERMLREKEPFDAAILDLMFAPVAGIPPEETDLGYRAGVFLWRRVVERHTPGLRFVVLTAVDPDLETYQHAVQELQPCAGYRGIFEKPVLIEDVLEALR